MDKPETISYDRLMEIARTYIEDDAILSEYGPIVSKLKDTCGCTKNEIEALGFGFMLENA